MSPKRKSDPDAVIRYQQAAALVDSLRRKAAETTGRLKVYRERLKSEFGCKTVQEAEAMLEQEQQKLTQQEKKLQRLLDEFEQKHGNQL